MKFNKILIVACVALCAVSVFSYNESVRRAERFERGQKFLQNLNPDSITEIVLQKGDESTHLRRDGEQFMVVDADGYPAKNESVNRFIRDVLKLSLEKEIGSGESLTEELELAASGANTIDVAFKGSGDEELVHFLVGKSMDDGGGSYVMRTDGEDDTIYLTSSRVYLSTGQDDFLKKEILDVETDDVGAIRGGDFEITGESGSLALADMPSGKKTSSKFDQLKSVLSGLRFSKHYLANAPEVQGLYFDSAVEIELEDGSGYQVAVATKGDKHYLRIQGFEDYGQLTVSPDDDEETTARIAEQLKRQTEIDEFNAFHGSWIYEVTETTANRVKVKKSDLYENA